MSLDMVGEMDDQCSIFSMGLPVKFTASSLSKASESAAVSAGGTEKNKRVTRAIVVSVHKKLNARNALASRAFGNA